MQKIVAAEVNGDALELFFHEGNSFRRERVDFSPFLLMTKDAVTPDAATVKTLAGNGVFCKLITFPSAADYEAALPELKKDPQAMIFRDQLQQALSILDIRLFDAVEFADLRRMQFAVKSDENGKIIKIETADSTGQTREISGSELEILSSFNAAVKAFDPDVLEGFNCCREDLVLLTKRAKSCKFTFDCGRDGSGFSMRASRFTAGEKLISYNRFALYGRHVVDVMLVAILYDAVKRELEEISEETLRENFQISDGSTAEFTGKLSAILTPAWFYRTRVLPIGYQDCILRGAGVALDALFVAEYLKHGHAIPQPESARKYAGALSHAEKHGVFTHVRHCDVRSLYPSLLLKQGIAPAKDELGIFLQLLEKLRRFRLEAKDRARALPPGKEKQQAQALQSSFKVLINSFYGYLGFGQGCFNDFELAEKVTAGGRELLTALVNKLESLGATIIEMDTDGIYFQLPENAGSNFDEQVVGILPAGIELEFDADYPAMFSYKAKNYALLNRDGSVSLTGAALKSRALEKFQRKFILEYVTALLHGNPDETEKIYSRYRAAIAAREFPLEDFAKSEVLSDSPASYAKKLASGSGRRSAAYELALSSGKKFRAGDKVRFYVTGEKAKVPVVGNSRLLESEHGGERNENIAYYIAKLDALNQALCQIGD